MLTGTALTWHEAITDGRAWDERRDAGRIRRTFITLAGTVRRWPAPVEFLEALPPVPEPLAIARESRPVSPEEAAANIARLKAMLGEVAQPVPSAKVERETTPEQREAIEADLRSHYSGKAAAAGPDL